MTTKLIGLKEFRQNIASFTNEARKKNIRFIVLKKNIPVLEVKAIDEKAFALEKMTTEIHEARQQVQQGKVYSQKEIMDEFGIS